METCREGTAEDFAKALPGRDLPADVLAVFPKTGGAA
jgi:hypothetical protein